ncbi:unnamed protein product [Closterium sp. NIES-54]
MLQHLGKIQLDWILHVTPQGPHDEGCILAARKGPAPSGVSQVDPLLGTSLVQVAVDSGAARGAMSGGAMSGGAEPGGVATRGGEHGGPEPEGVEPGGAAFGGAEPVGAESEGAETRGAEPGGVATGGGEPRGPEPDGVEPGGAASEQLREWFVRRTRLRNGASGAGGAGPAGAGGPRVAAGAGVTGGTATTGPGVGGTGARGVNPGGAMRPRPYFTGCLTKRREPASRPVSPVCTVHLVPRSRPPPVPGMHAMTLCPSSVPLCVPLPAPPESSLPEVPDPESDRARAASPTVSRLLATTVNDPSFESAAEDRQEEFESVAAAVPRFASMLLAPEGNLDAPDIPTPRSYAEAITGPYSSQWQAAMDAEMASWKSTGTYVDEVPLPGANIVDGMWIFGVKRPSGSPLAFKARYVARGFTQQQGVEYFQTFSPTPKMTTLHVLQLVAAQRNYELHSLDFSTAFLQGSLHEEIWLRFPPGFTESFPVGNQWSLPRLVYSLRQAPREWHNTLRTTLAALGFAPATADPLLFLPTDTALMLFYVLVHVDDLVFANADTEALTLVKSELQKRHTCTDLGELHSYLGLQITQDRAWRTITLTQSHMVHQVL